MASLIEFSGNSNERSSGDSPFLKNIERTMQVSDESGTAAFYIMNYQEKGFIILSADNRIEPIRAFSLTENFPMDSKYLPGGLIDWLSETNDMISEVRLKNEEQSLDVASSWSLCPMQQILDTHESVDSDKDKLIRLPIDDCGGGGGGGCNNTYITKGPLMSTTVR